MVTSTHPGTHFHLRKTPRRGEEVRAGRHTTQEAHRAPVLPCLSWKGKVPVPVLLGARPEGGRKKSSRKGEGVFSEQVLGAWSCVWLSMCELASQQPLIGGERQRLRARAQPNTEPGPGGCLLFSGPATAVPGWSFSTGSLCVRCAVICQSRQSTGLGIQKPLDSPAFSTHSVRPWA